MHGWLYRTSEQDYHITDYWLLLDYQSSVKVEFTSFNLFLQYLPPSGITIFANFFHTHVAGKIPASMLFKQLNTPTIVPFPGRALILEHYRKNEECGVLEELEPIDINLSYDFNYQQAVLLPQPRTVLPVSCMLVYTWHFVLPVILWLCMIISLCSLFSIWLSLWHWQGDIFRLRCLYSTEEKDTITVVNIVYMINMI